jgi:hypothetical protein
VGSTPAPRLRATHRVPEGDVGPHRKLCDWLPDANCPVHRLLRHAGTFQPGCVHGRRGCVRFRRLVIVRVLYGAGQRLHGYYPGIGCRQGIGRRALDPLDRVGPGRVRRRDVVHPTADRADFPTGENSQRRPGVPLTRARRLWHGGQRC